ncbi:MAG: hypothetical protein ACK5L3_01630, partial [Oscillospiraceae bacterium]
SYWYETEIFLFLGAAYLTARFFYKWYRPLRQAWPPQRARAGRIALALLPLAAFFIVFAVLVSMASYDVVGIWVVFYLLLGYAWVYGGTSLTERYLDVFSVYDVVFLNNMAALPPAIGSFLSIALIYAGANTGDGPGWWVVLIAGLLGLATWLALALLLRVSTGISERITVERNLGSGIRFGAYLLASGLILAYASGGDWMSFGATLADVGAAWPVLPLALLAFLVDNYYQRPRPVDYDSTSTVASSAVWGTVYLLLAAAALYAAVAPSLPGFAGNLWGVLQ